MPKFTKTPQELSALSRAVQTISRCKPKQHEITLKLTRAQVAIDRALEPFETERKELVKGYPPELKEGATPEEQVEYQKKRNAVDAEFKEMYENEKYEVRLPKPLKPTDILQFQETPSPNDLAILVPLMLDLGTDDEEE